MTISSWRNRKIVPSQNTNVKVVVKDSVVVVVDTVDVDDDVAVDASRDRHNAETVQRTKHHKVRERRFKSVVTFRLSNVGNKQTTSRK